MNRPEFINALATKTGISKKEAEYNLDAVLEVIEETLIDGEDIKFVGFGSWNVKERAARIGRNPRNPQEVINVPSFKTVTFKPGKTLKDNINDNLK